MALIDRLREPWVGAESDPRLEIERLYRLCQEAAAGGVVPKEPSVGIEDVLKGLTAKQLEVALLTAQGFTAKEVARKLGIRPSTVMSHRLDTTRRLGLNRFNLALLLMKAGLITETK